MMHNKQQVVHTYQLDISGRHLWSIAALVYDLLSQVSSSLLVFPPSDY